MSSFWNDFYFGGVSASTQGVTLVDYNNSGILKEYGLNFNIDLSEESVDGNIPIYSENKKSSDRIIIQLCRKDNIPWTPTDLLYLYKWLFTDRFEKFQVSDFTDKRYNIVYYLKAVSKKEFFTPEMKGYIEIEFQSYEPYAYIIPNTNIRLTSGTNNKVFSYSNLTIPYKPIFKITNQGTNQNVIKITNITNETSFSLKGVEKNETIYIDCKMGTVVNAKNENRFDVLQNYDFVSLIMGNNEIYLEGNVIAEVICEFPVLL